MQTFSVRDVERVLRLSRSTLRGLINAGFVTPARGARREYRFSFQDLIVLRAARALIDAKVSRRRITRALEDLRRHLPETVPLSGLSIRAVGDRVVVRDGQQHWQVDDGQYVLGLDVSVEGGTLRVIERNEANTTSQTNEPNDDEQDDEWFERALELESTDPAAALAAYARAVESDPTDVAAWTNWGRLLHERGELQEAERVYRRATEHCERDALLLFNFGVLLEDLHRTEEALDAYHGAIEADPTLADCHYNLARLYETMGQAQHAIRHLGQYRRLTSTR
jgi:tetratricopeptide (TPR) repeat protein